MSVDRSSRWVSLALAAGLLVGWLVRAWPLLGDGAFRVGADLYDDGVYVSAAALFVRGAWPYRDFVLVHPPLLTLVLSTVAWLKPKAAYVAARWLFVGIGTLNVGLAFVAARRWLGAWPAVAAVFVYALSPDVIVYERGAFLEPLLNTGAFTVMWLMHDATSARRWLSLGAVVGLMCSVKLTGVLWALPVAWCCVRGGGARALVLAVGAAVVVGVGLALPFAWHDPAAFFEQLVGFHVHRPADGTVAVWPRVLALWRRAWPLLVFCLGALALVFPKKRGLHGPLFGFTALTMVLFHVALLSAKTFWVEYGAVLAPLHAMAVALACAALSESFASPRVGLISAALVGVAVVLGAPLIIRQATTETSDATGPAQFLSKRLDTSTCVEAMEPLALLALDRLPQGQPLIVDTYGALLLRGLQTGAPTTSMAAVWAHAPVESMFKDFVTRCRFTVWGRRGDFQASTPGRAWVMSQGELHFPVSGEESVSVFEKR